MKRLDVVAAVRSIAYGGICFRRPRRRRRILSTRSSCSRRRAKGASAWKSHDASSARRAAACPSIGWRSRCESPQHYAGLLEHALERAGVPAYFERGTRRPHPAGRAFLALLRCAADNLSARRFAEYLSLGQVPEAGTAGAPTRFRARATKCSARRRAGRAADGAGDAARQRERGRTGPQHAAVRAPWKWERLLAESRVVATEQRWERRLSGLVARVRAAAAGAGAHRAGSPRIDQLARKIEDIRQLAAFALADHADAGGWPARATWGEWLERFESLASQVLKRPDRVLRVLADLSPMGAIGPIGLDEAAEVLADRLAQHRGRAAGAALRPPARDDSRAASRPQLRRRVRPGARRAAVSAEAARRSAAARRCARGNRAGVIGPASLITQTERADLEKLQLRLAIGAAESRLYVSFPTVEVGDGRPRVPSLYALEVWRAMTGRVPSADELQQVAARASHATLAWPAPADREEAIDPLEHDLSTLRGLVGEPDHRARGRAHYMLQLNDCLQRSVRERYMRGKRTWSHWDGIIEATERLKPVLETYRLGARAYSLSALQKIRRVPVSVLPERHLPHAAGRGSRAAAADGSVDARQPLPRRAGGASTAG